MPVDRIPLTVNGPLCQLTAVAAQHLVDVLRLVIDRRVAELAHLPLGDLTPQVEDLVIPTDDAQDDTVPSLAVSFATYARHHIIRPNRLALPDWLQVHRAGDVTIVCALVTCDFVMPISWCWRSPCPPIGRSCLSAPAR